MWQVRVAPCGDFDNRPFESAHFTCVPLAAAMGAEVRGVRLPDLSDEGVEDLKRALWKHKMLYLADQHLSHAEHAAFSRRLGPFAVDAYTQGVPEERDVHPIIKEADEVTPSLFGGGWHTDSPFLEEPPSITSCARWKVRPGVVTPPGPTVRWPSGCSARPIRTCCAR
jgi:alpha-ketoglutarate-dependent taurine dioxygenase